MSRLIADTLIRDHAPSTLQGFQTLERELARLRAEQPLVADESVDLVVATGLRYLDSQAARAHMLKDIHRIVRRGGRLIVVDVASDENLASGALPGADGGEELGRSLLREGELFESLAEAGFYGVTLFRREPLPWKIVDRVELRRVAIVAHKGKEGLCWERFQAVMYRGPFKSVEDDDGHTYPRGQQIAVCQKTFDILSRDPYRGQFEYTDPLIALPPEMIRPFPCNLTNPARDPKQLKFRLPAPGQPQPVIAAGPQRNPAATGPETDEGGAGRLRKKVVIFERSSPATWSPAQELAGTLREQAAGELEVRIVNLAEGNADAALPAQLRFRMSLSGEDCLPAIVVDGVLVALGALPERDEVARLIVSGRPFGMLPFANSKSLVAQASDCGSSTCC
jgi:hypothetical protein